MEKRGRSVGSPGASHVFILLALCLLIYTDTHMCPNKQAYEMSVFRKKNVEGSTILNGFLLADKVVILASILFFK